MQVNPLDPGSATPPFEQLRTQLAARVAAGDLPAGTKLPTVRALAADLGVANGTVARAYRELEVDGVLVTEGRRGTFVATTAATTDDAALRAAREYAGVARRLGLTRPEAIRLLDDAW
ncbi:GntR family transcriptional regulator [Nocardioides sp. CCNWLW212]